MKESKSNCQQPTVNTLQSVFILIFSLTYFGHYGCDNKQSKIISPPEAIKDSTTYLPIQSNGTSNTILRDSTSLIFLTFFYGMSGKEFNAEKDRLVSEGLLTRDHFFEPIQGVNLIISPIYAPNSVESLESIHLFQISISEKESKNILEIYKDKYGGNFTSKNTSRLTSSFFAMLRNEVEAGKMVTNEYSWQLSDGRKIVLELMTFTSLYKWRPGPNYESAQKKLKIEGALNEEDWIKIKSGEIAREVNIKYFSKEVVNRNKIVDDKINIEETERNSKKEKRIRKSRNSI